MCKDLVLPTPKDPPRNQDPPEAEAEDSPRNQDPPEAGDSPRNQDPPEAEAGSSTTEANNSPEDLPPKAKANNLPPEAEAEAEEAGSPSGTLLLEATNSKLSARPPRS
jgi:hypothetical protein